jgi:hypothetical protein
VPLPPDAPPPAGVPLRARGRLLKRGGDPPSLDEGVEEALVSRATAHRQFPDVDALLVDAPLDAEVPQPEQVFADADTDDAEERIDLAEARQHEMVYANQQRLRRLLAATLSSDGAAGDGPKRHDRRRKLIEAALAPPEGLDGPHGGARGARGARTDAQDEPPARPPGPARPPALR